MICERCGEEIDLNRTERGCGNIVYIVCACGYRITLFGDDGRDESDDYEFAAAMQGGLI